MSDVAPSSENPGLSTSRISASPGTKEYERQFARQSSTAIHAIVRNPFVRVVCGLLSILFCVMTIWASIHFVQSHLENGFQAWEFPGQVGAVVGLLWIISIYVRIASYGRI